MDRKIYLPLPRIENLFLTHPACNLLCMPTQPSYDSVTFVTNTTALGQVK
jgi:hypothetical protein